MAHVFATPSTCVASATCQRGVRFKRHGRKLTAVRAVHDRAYGEDKLEHFGFLWKDCDQPAEIGPSARPPQRKMPSSSLSMQIGRASRKGPDVTINMADHSPRRDRRRRGLRRVHAHASRSLTKLPLVTQPILSPTPSRWCGEILIRRTACDTPRARARRGVFTCSVTEDC